MARCDRIDYASLVSRAPHGTPLADYLEAELAHRWYQAYAAATPHEVNVQRVVGGDGARVLFDLVEALVLEGRIDEAEAVPDRVVAVQGRSKPPSAERDAARLRSFPLGAAAAIHAAGGSAFDRGHLLSHAGGGGLDVNLVPQLRALNRGWSEQGRRFRAMEAYAAERPGTYCFARPIYTTRTDHPRWIELGVLRDGTHLDVEVFDNVADDSEMSTIERVFREQVLRTLRAARGAPSSEGGV